MCEFELEELEIVAILSSHLPIGLRNLIRAAGVTGIEQMKEKVALFEFDNGEQTRNTNNSNNSYNTNNRPRAWEANTPRSFKDNRNGFNNNRWEMKVMNGEEVMNNQKVKEIDFCK